MAKLEGLLCGRLIARGASCGFALPEWFTLAAWAAVIGGITYTIVRGYLDFFTAAYYRDLAEADIAGNA